MSVLKSLDINLPQSEKRTLRNFLLLYAFFVVIILGFMMFFYYASEMRVLREQEKLFISEYADDFIVRLEKQNIQKSRHYPKDIGISTAIYDRDYKLIYATIKNPKTTLDQVVYDRYTAIRYLKNPDQYYKNTQYILVKMDRETKGLVNVAKRMLLYGAIGFIFMLNVGYFLLKLFLKPMRDALHLLDTFIKDTTHELNTPVSTIITNIEMIDTQKLEDKKLAKKIARIDIGAKTISNIYNDLTYLILNNKIISDNRDISLKDIIQQRIEYFKTLANAKKISITSRLESGVMLYIDEKKISKLLDNLISNAIKYNRVGGSIEIVLEQNLITIKDSGRGISQENIDLIFDRYARFDKSVGGFGIGLNIVKMICDEYNLDISIESKLDVYTKIKIRW